MKLILSFSGRANGNCDEIAKFLAEPGDTVRAYREVQSHACSGCNYECFSGECKYRADEVYGLYQSMASYDKVLLIVPMYCGNPLSLYFQFVERGQDFFMHNEDCYEDLLAKLFLIGVYGSANSSPDFLPCLEKWFEGTPYQNHVLGIERHRYGQTLSDSILEAEDVKAELTRFVGA